MTLLELMVAIGIASMLLLLGATLTTSVLKSSSETNNRIFSSIDQDLGLRWVIPIIESSNIMRVKEAGQRLIDCSNTLNLSETTGTPAPLLLQASAAHLNIAFAAFRSAGSSSLSVTNAIFVPSTSVFQKGQLILLSTLDAQKRTSIYRVVAVDVAQSLIQLVPNYLELPPVIGCNLRLAADPDAILNPTETKKYLVSIIQFAKLEFIEDQKDRSLNLQGLHWKRFLDEGSELASFALAKNATQLEIAESYFAQTETKGRYHANLKLEYELKDAAGASKKKVVEVKTGYNMSGIEIANEAALPLPPSVEFMDVTCSLNYVSSYTDYALKDSGATIPIHRISVLMTDETRVKASSPSITLTMIPPDASAKIRCWNFDKLSEAVDFNMHSFLLEGDGSQYDSKFVLSTNLNSSDPNLYFQPVYCYSSGPTQALAVLKFVDSVAGINRSISCSPATLDGLLASWKYEGPASSCKRSGEITLGRLVNVANPAMAGPALRIKEEGCRWSGTTSKSCNAFQVLEDEPNAELLEVQLLPSDLVIQSGPVGNKVICL